MGERASVPEREVTHVIRIQPSELLSYLRRIKQHEDLDFRIIRKFPNIEIFLDLYRSSLSIALEQPLEVAPVNSSDAFKFSVRNRIIIGLNANKENVLSMIRQCVSVLQLLGKEASDEEREEVHRCRRFINSLSHISSLGLATAEAIFSIELANLPITMQPNVLKALAGYHTD